MAKLVFVTGGVRSGKSYYAEQLAQAYNQVTYIATGWAGDDEMTKRIRRHQERRPASWQTIEEQVDLAGVLSKVSSHCILIDCLGMWISNLLAEPQRDVEQELQGLLKAIDNYTGTIIIVSNEVGWGLVPMNALGRQFCDLLGRANRLIANQAAEAWLLVAGFPLNLVEVAGKWRIK